MEHEGDSDIIVISVLGTIPAGLVKRLEDFEIRGQVEKLPDYHIIKIGQNTEKILEELERFNADAKNSQIIMITIINLFSWKGILIGYVENISWFLGPRTILMKQPLNSDIKLEIKAHSFNVESLRIEEIRSEKHAMSKIMNGKKNNGVAASSNKLRKWHTRGSEHGYAEEIWREKLLNKANTK